MKKIIISADDFGCWDNITEGIIKVYKEGILTEANLMVNRSKKTDYAVKLAKQNPSLSLGIHLNLTFDKPILPKEKVPSLVIGEEVFFEPKEGDLKLLASHLEKINHEEAKNELETQILYFKKLIGKLPSHIDCHHYLQGHPKILPCIIELALKYKLPVTLPLWDNKQGNPHNPQLQKWTCEKLHRANIVTTDYIISSFRRGNVTQEYLNKILSSLPEGITELRTHTRLPRKGIRKEEFNPFEKQLPILISSTTKNLIKEQNIQLINYKNLPR